MSIPVLTDPTAVPVYAPSAFQRFAEGFLYEGRDAVFVRHSLKVLVLVAPGRPKFVWLVTLKNSERNWSLTVSWIGKALCTPRSH